MIAHVKENYSETTYNLMRENIIAEYEEEKRERTIYFIKQRLSGFVLVLCGLAAMLLCGIGEGIFFIALGLYVMFTNTRMMMFKGYRGIGKY